MSMKLAFSADFYSLLSFAFSNRFLIVLDFGSHFSTDNSLVQLLAPGHLVGSLGSWL